MEEEPFTKQMRKATKEIHALSDALVNAKLALTLSNNIVWAEGLLVFYEIFRFLDEVMLRTKDGYLHNLNIEGMRRTEAFEEDLNFYLGENWKDSYTPRDSVVKYLLHLTKLEHRNPDLLMAYVYHLYMGLMSGGQILKKKREVMNRLIPLKSDNQLGNAVVTFKNKEVAKIKRDLVSVMNSIAKTFDEKLKQELIEESKMVFILNNELIRSVRGTTNVFVKKLLVTIGILILVMLLFYLFM